MNWFIKGEVMRKIIICIFLVLTFICSCSDKNKTASDSLEKEKALGDGKQYTDTKKAIEYLNNDIKLQPNNAENYAKRGNVYYSLGQSQQALEDFNKAIGLKQDYAEAYNNRGGAYINLGQYQQAIEDFNKAIGLKQDYTNAYNNRGGAYLLRGNKKLGCRDAQKACALGNCKSLEWAKGKGYCR
jgi:tetratricopeptide (TPR) repeat protein